jgi:hypothetical protein
VSSAETEPFGYLSFGCFADADAGTAAFSRALLATVVVDGGGGDAIFFLAFISLTTSRVALPAT